MLTSTHKSQQGAALIVSLIILVALTMLSITSMRGSSSELTMAGSLRESGLTFQAAEAGLRTAEALVASSTSSGAFDGKSTSMLAETSPDPDYLNNTSWAGATAADITLAGISNKPKYIIKFLGAWSQNPLAKVNAGSGYGGQAPGREVSNYRVTSRGTGQTETSFRTVQSYYGIEY